ncbi:hypothetical protein ABW21_db0205022 [Orbilia brochopaga]|nr:hypothetical protein ABW21_db0205022 [Drechslerella brochopaga]
MRHFHPLEVTVTLRHTDFWYWEDDAPLRVGSNWVHRCKFPNSTRVIRVELESLERKKASIDHLAQQAIEKWEFTRMDGTKLTAKRSHIHRTQSSENEEVIEHDKGETEVMRWSGSSTWEGRRWLRDEVNTEPGKLQYYVKSVVWRVKPPELATKAESEAIGGAATIPVPQSVSQESSEDEDEDDDNFSDSEDDADISWNVNSETLYARPDTRMAHPAVISALTTELEEMGCDDSMSADQITTRVLQWRHERYTALARGGYAARSMFASLLVQNGLDGFS